MYRRSSRQPPLIRAGLGLHASAAARMEAGWPAQFAAGVLPLLFSVEDQFALLYDPEVGRPNWGVARMLGVLILQELFALPDQAALDALSYDVRWHRALDVGMAGAYLTRRSLVGFRSMLAQADPEATRLRNVFETLLRAQLAELGLVVRAVRLDSTHTCSNIMTRGRLDLFMSALSGAVRVTSRLAPALHQAFPKEILEACESDADGTFGGISVQEARNRLPKVAQWMVVIRDRLATVPAVAMTEEFQILDRVIREHVRVEPANETAHPGAAEGGGSDGPPGESPLPESPPTDPPAPEPGRTDPSSEAGPPPEPVEPEMAAVLPVVEVVKPTFPAATLQSVHDPDAGYSKKGVGYHVQVAETCDHEGVRLIVDYDVHSASVSDHGQAERCSDRLEKQSMKPKKMYTDCGYVSGASLVAFGARGVVLHGPVSTANLSPDMATRTSWRRDPETGRLAACPKGNPVTRHADRKVEGKKKPHAFVDRTQCLTCPLKDSCQARPTKGAKERCIEDTPAMQLRDEQYDRQRTEEWRDAYSVRSGVEGTMSELKRKHGLRRLRVRRVHRVRIAVAMKIIACNMKRMAAGPR